LDPILLALLLLLALPLTLALLAGAAYALSRRWQGEAVLAGEEATRVLVDTRRETSGLRRIQAEYAELHRQPYAQLAEELMAEVVEVEREAAELELDWQKLDAYREVKTVNRLRGFLQAAPDAYTQRQMAVDLNKRCAEIRMRLQASYSLVQRLDAVPAEVTGRAMRVDEGTRAFQTSLSTLKGAGLSGRMMEEAEDALLQVQQSQARIPAQFDPSGNIDPPTQPEGELGPSKTENRQSAGEMHDLLIGIEPVLGEWLPRVQGWEQQHHRLVDAGQNLQKTIVNFRSALANAPAQLVVSRYQAVLLQVSAAAAELEERRAGAEVKDLRALERETSLLERTLEETALQYDRSVVEVGQLDRLLLQLESDFKLLAGRMAQNEIHETYPLAWDTSRLAQNDMQEKIASLGQRELKRTPEEVAQALAAGNEYLEQLGALLEKTTEQNGLYTDLIQLLETTELAEGGEWARRAVLLTREMAVFDPANWSKQDDVGTLVRDIGGLDELQRRLVPAEKPAAIKESGLPRRLAETRQLAGLHQKQRPRVDRVRSRLTELRVHDQDARDDLERLTAAIDQLALLLNNNTYLQETAAVELSRLRGESGRLAEELGRPEAGVLEKKIQRLNAAQEGLAKAASGWLDRLSANIQIHTRSIADELAALDQVAALDDREVIDSREVLRRLGPAPSYPRPANYMEAASGLKRCAADWQSAAACAAALESCGEPVLAAARDADAARKSAQAVFQSAAKLAGGRREWPPARQTLVKELEEFRKLEARLDGLHGQRWSAGRLVRELTLLYHELDKIEDRAAGAVRQAEVERAAELEAERTVTELTRKWQGLGARYPGQAGIADGARDLVGQSEQRLSYMRAQYRRGSMDYDQVLTGLEDLAASLRGARFSTEDGKSVGVDG
jgi:hypothetical protein